MSFSPCPSGIHWYTATKVDSVLVNHDTLSLVTYFKSSDLYLFFPSSLTVSITVLRPLFKVNPLLETSTLSVTDPAGRVPLSDL